MIRANTMLHLPPPSSGRRVARSVFLLAAYAALGVLVPACGGGDGPPPPPRDIGAFDLGRDLGSTDLGGDGATADGGSDAGMLECTVEAPDMLGSEAGSIIQRVAITNLVNDFAVVFRERRPTFDDLWVRVYRDTMAGVVAGSDFPITTDAGGSSVSGQSRDPALVATSMGYVAAWIDSREMGFEMWTRVLDADGIPSASLQRVTTSSGAAVSPALGRTSNGALVAGYIHDDTQAGSTREFFVAPVTAATGALSGAWMRVSANGELTSQAALVTGQTAGLLSGWVDGTGNARVRQITQGGAPTGTAVTHGRADALGLDSSLLIFSRNDGFDALWAQAITDVGETDGLLRSALTADATGRDPSVAALLGGAVVAYRHTTQAGTQIALALINSRGERVHTELLGTTTTIGGPISVAVNNEGRIRIAWAEVDAGTTTTFTQAVQCSDPG